MILLRQQILLDLLELGLLLGRRLADDHVGGLRAHRQAERLELGLPGAGHDLLHGVLDLEADAGDRVGDVERIGAAAIGVAADDVRTLLARRLFHAAQAEIEDVVVDVGALGDGGQGRLLGLGDVVEVAGIALEVLDLGIDESRAVAELDAGVLDGRDLEAADIGHAAGLGQHGGRRAGGEGDLGLTHVVARDIVGLLGIGVAADDGEFHLGEARRHLEDRRLGLAADADHQIVLAGQRHQHLLHVAELHVLDVLDGDLAAELLLRGLQSVVTQFHPAFVGFRARNQHADREWPGRPCRSAQAAQHHQPGGAGCTRQKPTTIEIPHGLFPRSLASIRK